MKEIDTRDFPIGKYLQVQINAQQVGTEGNIIIVKANSEYSLTARFNLPCIEFLNSHLDSPQEAALLSSRIDVCYYLPGETTSVIVTPIIINPPNTSQEMVNVICRNTLAESNVIEGSLPETMFITPPPGQLLPILVVPLINYPVYYYTLYIRGEKPKRHLN
jgi:hypothetical protein